MRILHSQRSQSRGSQGVYLDATLAAPCATKHVVRVILRTSHERAGLGSENRGTTMVCRLQPASATELTELAYSIPARTRLARAAREFSPDVIHEHYNLFSFADAVLARQRNLSFLLEVGAFLSGAVHTLRRLACATAGFVWCRADRALPVAEALAGRAIAVAEFSISGVRSWRPDLFARRVHPGVCCN